MAKGKSSGPAASPRPDRKSLTTREATVTPTPGGAGAKPRRRGIVIGVLAAAALIVAGIVAYFSLGAHETSVPAASAGAASASLPAASFVGGAACAGCHAKAMAAWRGSDHDLAMQEATDAAILGDFGGAKFSYAGTTSTFFKRDGKHYVNTDGPDGRLADYEIKYAFGVHPLQQYLIELPGGRGRMQALSIAWDSRPKAAGGQRWFHMYPGQNIKAGDPLHWTGIGQNWNYQCAECHSTNLRKNYDAQADAFKTSWSELNVACEACHGPGSNHLLWAKKEGEGKRFDDKGMGLAIALDERKGVQWMANPATGNAQRSAPRTAAREIEMCARCHGRAGRMTDDYVYGKPPGDSHRLAGLDDPLYWNDGQMRDEVYNWGSFVQSKMYAMGVTCSDCHDPHTLKLRQPGNAVCAQCHLPTKYDSVAHTHHREGTPGAGCAECHMPTTTYMIVDPRHDHSMRIPRPDLSAKLGMPNACNNCHAKESPQWAADAIRSWVGSTPVGYQRFAEALAAGSSGAPGARGALLAVINDRAEPAIARASAIDRLGPGLSQAMVDAVARTLNDPDPMVRAAAVTALEGTEPAIRQRYLARMLSDPVRVVRVEAARALAGPAEAGLAPADRDAFLKALDEYIAVQTYNADRPDGRMNLGTLYAERHDPERAINEYRKAIEIDPTFVPVYANLADLYRARGAENEAEKVLREGLARNPKSSVLEYALGLALVRQKRSAESLDVLRDAAKGAPDNARFAYVYAVALDASGQSREALKVLDAARKRNPYDRNLLSALAHYTAAAGNRDAALAYVRQLRELDPENREFAQMEMQISGPAPLAAGRPADPS